MSTQQKRFPRRIHFTATSKQFQSDFRAISEQFQSNCRAIAGQLPSNWNRFNYFHRLINFRAILVEFRMKHSGESNWFQFEWRWQGISLLFEKREKRKKSQRKEIKAERKREKTKSNVKRSEEFHRNWISFWSHFRHRILFAVAFIRPFSLSLSLSLSSYIHPLCSILSSFSPRNIEPEENGAALPISSFSPPFPPPPPSSRSLFPPGEFGANFEFLFSFSFSLSTALPNSLISFLFQHEK